MPCVSVIIPVYNRREYVQEAIDSVLAQTYKDYEIIVVDDGSTDGTGELLRSRYGDQIRYERQKNQGASVARNRGVELARGTYVAFLDSDDLWLPNKLANQVAFLEANPNTAMVISQAWRIDAQGNRDSDRTIGAEVTTESLALDRLCLDCCIASPTLVLVSSGVLQAAGGFDPVIRYGEDWDLWLRVHLLADIGVLAEPLALIRRHRAAICHYPSWEGNPRRRADYLTVMRKFFAAWPAAPDDLQRRAFAWVYAFISVLESAVGNDQACRACLEQVAVYDASLLGDQERFGMAIAGQAALLYESTEDASLSSSRRFVESVLGAIADTGYGNRSFERATWAKSYEGMGFTAYRKGDLRATRHCFARALVLSPSLVRNTGLLALWFEAVAGERASSLRRTVWSRLPRRRSSSTDRSLLG